MSHPIWDDYDEADFLAIQPDPEKGLDPSERYGLKLAIPFMCGLILFAAVIAASVFYCSKYHETYRNARRDGKIDLPMRQYVGLFVLMNECGLHAIYRRLSRMFARYPYFVP